ncbi:MAG: cysteine--tRNA ligase [Planctomycetaceae bacterium]
MPVPERPLRLMNTLSRSIEPFRPIDPAGRRVNFYSCGPTVYDDAHIGNFRSFLNADVLRRTLELLGHEVRHVMNITDVGHMTEDSDADGGGEDKMAVAGRRIAEAKKSGALPAGVEIDPGNPYAIADFYAGRFLEDARRLGLKVAEEAEREPLIMPRPTAYVPQMIELVRTLVDRGHAYVGGDGVVYFDVRSFPAYGRLSNNTLEALKEGAGERINATNQANKRHPADFMLWKPDSSHIMKWDSPWGAGYPGWHIECSCMARKRLGRDVIDIHTGGEDLIFPHHECEIAQTCGATGETTFARFWMHARFLLVEGQKMSKSRGNFYTVRDVLQGRVRDEKGQPTGVSVHPAVLRLELLKSHYRGNMNFTHKGLIDSAGVVRRLTEFRSRLEAACGGRAEPVDLSHPVLQEFAAALADDLNIAGALGAILPWAATTPADPAVALGVLERVNQVLAVAPLDVAPAGVQASDEQAEVRQLCNDLDDARKRKDFAAADLIRGQIQKRGYDVKTSPIGTVAEKRLA